MAWIITALGMCGMCLVALMASALQLAARHTRLEEECAATLAHEQEWREREYL